MYEIRCSIAALAPTAAPGPWSCGDRETKTPRSHRGALPARFPATGRYTGRRASVWAAVASLTPTECVWTMNEASTSPGPRFPTDDEVTEWISEHLVASHLPHGEQADTAEADQRDAAVRERGEISRRMGRAGVATGQFVAAYEAGELDPESPPVRGTVKAMLAADSAGLNHLCSHTLQIKPTMFFCDPPSVICVECYQQGVGQADLARFRWDNTCDRCGNSSTMLTHLVSTLGPTQVVQQVCGSCLDEHKSYLEDHAERKVVPADRNEPCPCGSGKKYKRCHGR